MPWLLPLLVIGAIGGYLSRRAQGSGWRVYVAGLFPALATGLALALVLPAAFVVNPQVAPEFKFISLMAMVVSWVILPGIALYAGVALQGLRKPRQA